MSKSEESSYSVPLLPLAALLVAVAAFYLLTLRDGHNWGGDFAQYLYHAENLANGRPYAQVDYVYNPLNNVVGPKAYPPVFPASLAPTLRLFGRNLLAVKIELILFFLATIAVTSWLFSRDLSRNQLLLYAALLGFSPALWQYKETILSEHLFLPLWYLAILVADNWYRGRRILVSPVAHAVLLGVLIYLACGTRSVAIVLLPSVLVMELVVTRRLTRFGCAAMATAVILILVQKMLLPVAGQGYTEQLSQIGFATLKRNILANATSVGNLWENGYSMIVAMILTGVTSLVVAAAFCRRNWPRPTFLGVATLLYLALIIIWPSATGLRLTLPLLPAVLFYVILGLSDPIWNPTTQRRLLIGFAVLMTVNYLAWYNAADYGPIPGIEDPMAVELFQYIEENTDPGDICLFFKPRVLAFFAHRPASAYPLVDDDTAFWDYVDSAGITVLIARKDATAPPESTVAQPADSRMIPEWENNQFRVVRLREQ